MDELLIATSDVQISEKDFLIRLLVAAGSGFLIGLEREYAARKANEKTFAGVRSFIFLTLLGFAGGLLYTLFSVWLLVGVFAGVIAIIAVSYWITSRAGDIGGTTELTAILAFVLGILAFFGFIEISLVFTVAIVVVLSSKLRLHRAIGAITPEEMVDIIRFVVLALLIFPFLPDQNYGPYDVINPKEIGLVILLTSGIGFIGYLLMKFLGSGKGILITGVVGGLVSSTAVTWVFSRKSKVAPELSSHCATAILSASTVMVMRMLLLIALFNVLLLKQMAPALIIVLVAGIGAALNFYKKSGDHHPNDGLPQGTPLQLQSAIAFGIAYTIIKLLVSYASERYGAKGILISGAISGLTDIDAITISVSRIGLNDISSIVRERALLLAALSNSLVKLGIGIWAGSQELRMKLLGGFSLIILALFTGFLLIGML